MYAGVIYGVACANVGTRRRGSAFEPDISHAAHPLFGLYSLIIADAYQSCTKCQERLGQLEPLARMGMIHKFVFIATTPPIQAKVVSSRLALRSHLPISPQTVRQCLGSAMLEMLHDYK